MLLVTSQYVCCEEGLKYLTWELQTARSQLEHFVKILWYWNTLVHSYGSKKAERERISAQVLFLKVGVMIFHLTVDCICFSSHPLDPPMLLQHHHSSLQDPMLHSTGPLSHLTASLVLHPLQLSSLDLLEQEVRCSSFFWSVCSLYGFLGCTIKESCENCSLSFETKIKAVQ